MRSRRRKGRGASGPLFGVMFVDKPAGPTSREVVDWVRWALGARSVGHCGTLDPAATGLLVLLVGNATKLAPYYTASEKTYRAAFTLGVATDTADGEGEVIARGEVPGEVWARVEDALMGMTGVLELPPPAHAAVKIDGVRAYELAREGRAPEMPPRPMFVHGVSDVTIDRDAHTVRAELDVGKGTYVRSLAVELGRRLGVPAHMSALYRSMVGPFMLVGGREEVGPLVAEPMEPARDGAPRHRIRPAADACGPRRADQAAWLRKRLFSPLLEYTAPLQVYVAEHEALRGLCQGRPVELPGADELLMAPGREEPWSEMEKMRAERILVTDRARHAVVVARADGDEADLFAPDRVVRPPPSAQGAP